MPQTAPDGSSRPPPKPKDTTRANGAAVSPTTGKKAYLRMCINGRWVSVLMDSGCEHTILPGWLVHASQLRPTSRKVMAANGSGISILGTARVTAMIGQKQFAIEGLVSDSVTEPMIGIEWMEQTDVYWMFKRGAIQIQGQIYKLTEGQQRDVWVQRIIRIQATTGLIPDLSQSPSSSLTHVNAVGPGRLRRNLRCYRCHTPGHFKRDCP